MGFAALFFGFAALFLGIAAYLVRLPGPLGVLLALPFIAAGLGDVCAGSLYLTASVLRINPGRLFKRSDGTVRNPPRVAVWPYLFFEYRIWRRYRRRAEEPLFERVREGLYQGARILNADVGALREAGITAVLDLVAEFEAPSQMRSNPEFEYLAIPTLDGTAPTRAELERGAEFVAAMIGQGRRVLVHCTFGHGRSSTFSAAALMRIGDVQTPYQALAILARLDRRIWLSREQKKLLARFKGN